MHPTSTIRPASSSRRSHLLVLAAIALPFVIGACSDSAATTGPRAVPPGPTTAAAAQPGAATGPIVSPTCPGGCQVDPGRILFYDTLTVTDGIAYSVAADGTGLRQEYMSGKGPAWIGTQRSWFVVSRSWYGSTANLEMTWVGHGTYSGTQKITDNFFMDEEPATSPDGKLTAFVSDRVGNHEIYTAPTYNSDPAKADVQRLTYSTADDRWPHWAPNGSFMIFASTRGQRAGGYHIWMMGAGGLAPVQLNAIEGRNPVYSPDGHQIAFTTKTAGGDRIAIMTAAGENVTIVQNGLKNSFEPSWSRDGTSIAFASTDGAWTGINVMKADGANVKHVASIGHMPKWSR